MKVLIAVLLLSLSIGKSCAETTCEKARQYASSTAQLVALAAANGIMVSKSDEAKIKHCFKNARPNKRRH